MIDIQYSDFTKNLYISCFVCFFKATVTVHGGLIISRLKSEFDEIIFALAHAHWR